MYIAHVSGKGSRKEFTSQAHTTRECAAAELFVARPTARSCSTCVAFERDGVMVQSHCNIYFHDRNRIAA